MAYNFLFKNRHGKMNRKNTSRTKATETVGRHCALYWNSVNSKISIQILIQLPVWCGYIN